MLVAIKYNFIIMLKSIHSSVTHDNKNDKNARVIGKTRTVNPDRIMSGA
jgi:hypothetical protein